MTETARPVGPDEAARISTLRVLIAEDFEPARRLLLRMLDRHAISASAAEDGQDALEQLTAAADRGEPYELLLLDLSMPRLDGIGVLRYLAAHTPAQDRPYVVVISASAFDEQALLAQLGADQLLPKPLRRPQLSELLSTVADRTHPTP